MIIVRESYCGKAKLLIYYSISILSTLISPMWQWILRRNIQINLLCECATHICAYATPYLGHIGFSYHRSRKNLANRFTFWQPVKFYCWERGGFVTFWKQVIDSRGWRCVHFLFIFVITCNFKFIHNLWVVDLIYLSLEGSGRFTFISSLSFVEGHLKF